MKRLYRRTERGDTIVEVLLAIAVLGMVLGTAFAIVNRSLATGRDAQERSEALKFAEAQLESLKLVVSRQGNTIEELPANTIFCLSGQAPVSIEVGTIAEDTDLDAYPDECTVGTGDRYRLSISQSGDLFVVRSRWDRIMGSQMNEVRLSYRVYSHEAREQASVISSPTIDLDGPTAHLGGTVIDWGSSPLTLRGVWYTRVAGSPAGHCASGESEGVCMHATSAIAGSPLGDFGVDIQNLEPGVTYYYRAFIRNSSGTYYGEEHSFDALPVAPPTVTTSAASAITHIQATLSGNVSKSGGRPVTRKGIVIGRSTNPSVDNDATNRTINSSSGGTGPISLTAQGLLPNTTYYVRAFAINSDNMTGYGEQQTFRTNDLPGGVGVTVREYGGHTYFVSNQLVPWATARTIADQSGGHLVTIKDAAENSFVSTLASGNHIWIGFNDRSVEGRWVWENGEAVTYTNWSAGEPNNYGEGEDVAVMNWGTIGTPSYSQWNDWYNNPTTTARFVIEFDN